jgi:hypothetical protein
MSKAILTANFLVLAVSTIVAVSNFSNAGLASAQMSTSSGKMHLDEGIKVLNGGDVKGALMHLKIADKILSGITSNSAQTARMHLDEGIKVLNGGDVKGALMHLKIADKILGSGSG